MFQFSPELPQGKKLTTEAGVPMFIVYIQFFIRYIPNILSLTFYTFY